MAELSQSHQNQLQAFLKFATYKRKQHAKEVLQCVTDAIERIQEGDVFSGSEVNKLLGDLMAELQTYVLKETENAYHSSALLVKLLLLQAQGTGSSLGVDTSQLENELMLRDIKATEAVALCRPAADFQQRSGLGALGTAPLQPVNLAATNVAQERDRLKEEVAALRGRLEALQTASTAALKEKSQLAQQLEQAHQQLLQRSEQLQEAQELLEQSKEQQVAVAEQQRGAVKCKDSARQQVGHALEEADKQVAVLLKQVAEKDKEAKAAQAALDGRLQECKQWQQMKKMMQAKGQEVVALRQRLAKYEPQEVPSAEKDLQ